MSSILIDDFNVYYTNNNDLGPWVTSIPKIQEKIKK